MRYEWDLNKAGANLQKHGVSFAEAITVFDDPLAVERVDPDQPDRRRLTGVSAANRLLLTVYVEVAGDIFRIITARLATPHERRRYEEEGD